MMQRKRSGRSAWRRRHGRPLISAFLIVAGAMGAGAYGGTAQAFAILGDRTMVNPNAGQPNEPASLPNPHFWNICVAANLNGGNCALTVTYNTNKPLNAKERLALRNGVGQWNSRFAVPTVFNGVVFDTNLGQITPATPVIKKNRGIYDVQSALMHELGHAWGLDHPEVSADRTEHIKGNDLPILGPRARCTASTIGAPAQPGGDVLLDCQPGADKVFGTADDLRGDDQSLHLVDADNNPFNAFAGSVDRQSFSLLHTFNNPMPNSFAQTSTREVAKVVEKKKLEAVMVQKFVSRETRRRLTHDDFNGIRYLESGKNQRDGAPGTADGLDDFRFNFAYNPFGATEKDRFGNPPANIQVLVSKTNIARIAVTQPIINRTPDLILEGIHFALGVPDELSLATDPGDILGRTDIWLNSQGDIAFADIFLVSSIPEPPAVLLFGLGLIILACLGQRGGALVLCWPTTPRR